MAAVPLTHANIRTSALSAQDATHASIVLRAPDEVNLTTRNGVMVVRGVKDQKRMARCKIRVHDLINRLCYSHRDCELDC